MKSPYCKVCGKFMVYVNGVFMDFEKRYEKYVCRICGHIHKDFSMEKEEELD